MNDRLIRALSADGRVRVIGVNITQSLNEAYCRHHLSTVATAALGRTMSASLLLASNMKQPQSRVNVRIAGDGELGLVYADAGFDGSVRGFVSNHELDLAPDVDGQQNVSAAIGKTGLLKVLRDVGYGEPYSSTVELIAGDVATDIAWFLASSEQTYSKLILTEVIDPPVDTAPDRQAAPVKAAAGILLQIMPKAALRAAKTSNFSQEDLLKQLETVSDKAKFTDLLMQNKSIEEVMLEMFADLQIEILPLSKDVRFHCPCTLERMLAAIKLFGEDDLRSMITEDKGAEATCHFCSEVYHATTDQLNNLLMELQVEAKA
ncbi:Hsp33 family molecular chaperone HslO [Pseudanabaena sp. FACHB-1998]|uniref:Hsp33 family molecular chaperone HslO n=1 Tax=Pseudanabaena sp. FACHB-1998 TaxID=2692858 RepID=UPI0016819247|nr:Hsp33 family molecular chaperone HslO [Pseudanabaena sp. FACHB-1998]MBD2175847.1 Hsp33 family molecular chaperone HslO [Pseudanabaena sp. FACHB-1998]